MQDSLKVTIQFGNLAVAAHSLRKMFIVVSAHLVALHMYVIYLLG